MSLHYMKFGVPEVKDYSQDGMTKQAFKDSTDINKILLKAQKKGSLDHLTRYQGVYADYSDYDFLENAQKLTEGKHIFQQLPPEIRREFNNSPNEFFSYVNDPENKDRLKDVFPELAKPGSYFPDVSNDTPPGGLLAPKDEQPVIDPPPKDEQAPKDEQPVIDPPPNESTPTE